jgi:hypothetical protein
MVSPQALPSCDEILLTVNDERGDQMFKIILALTIIVSLACGTSTVIAQQVSSDAQKVKAKVVKIGVGEEARVEVRLRDGRRVKGYISEIENDYFFTVVDDNAGVATRIDYSQVQKLSARMSPHKARQIRQIIISGALFGFLIYLFALANNS